MGYGIDELFFVPVFFSKNFLCQGLDHFFNQIVRFIFAFLDGQFELLAAVFLQNQFNGIFTICFLGFFQQLPCHFHGFVKRVFVITHCNAIRQGRAIHIEGFGIFFGKFFGKSLINFFNQVEYAYRDST